ncbi:pre-mRNA-splicing factor CWC22 homolog [Oppia nitens]|uniref:pre-mRNA-splicing factor CWC22 homolog n=1 Tax=Oppia nitens TaxID=1686743 RepID=UPI0023DAF602|nr:pre-mRNA-splicing factor CWC22 homolog [Oppia nitens]
MKLLIVFFFTMIVVVLGGKKIKARQSNEQEQTDIGSVGPLLGTAGSKAKGLIGAIKSADEDSDDDNGKATEEDAEATTGAVDSLLANPAKAALGKATDAKAAVDKATKKIKKTKDTANTSAKQKQGKEQKVVMGNSKGAIAITQKDGQIQTMSGTSGDKKVKASKAGKQKQKQSQSVVIESE